IANLLDLPYKEAVEIIDTIKENIRPKVGEDIAFKFRGEHMEGTIEKLLTNSAIVGRTTNDWRDARYWLQMSQNIPNTKIYLGMLENNINPAKYIRAMGIGPEAISDDDFSYPSTSLGGFNSGPTATELAGA